MNAAFLLVTTAWIAGADAAAPATPLAPAAAAPVYSAGTGGCAGGGCSSCGTCDSCGSCDGESEGFFAKLKARFHHASADCGCGCESETHVSTFKGFGHQAGCGCDSGCGGCGSPCDACGGAHSGGGLGEKLRGLFHRGGDCGCETSCGGCGGCASGGCGGVISPIPGGTMPKELIGPPKEEPKKLPSGDKDKPAPEKEKKPGAVQLIPQPVGIPDLEIAPTGGKSPF